jgi:very-short-patch-repair endonuclease
VREESAKAQRSAAKLAARQHGVVSFGQLVRAGLGRASVTRRIREGWLHRVHRGVYALGTGNLTREGYFMAAVLAVGKGAVLSHASAAALHKLSPTCPPIIHVTVPGWGGRSRRKGIVIHRSSTLTPAEITIHRGIPVTTVPRTLADLGWGPERTRSDLERLFLRICREHGIPKPEVNVRLGPYEVDFLWRAERLVVEVDGYRYHSGRAAFGADRIRDRELQRHGFVVLRFTDRELDTQPQAVAASLRAHLDQRLRKLSMQRPLGAG